MIVSHSRTVPSVLRPATSLGRLRLSMLARPVIFTSQRLGKVSPPLFPFYATSWKNNTVWLKVLGNKADAASALNVIICWRREVVWVYSKPSVSTCAPFKSGGKRYR